MFNRLSCSRELAPLICISDWWQLIFPWTFRAGEFRAPGVGVMVRVEEKWRGGQAGSRVGSQMTSSLVSPYSWIIRQSSRDPFWKVLIVVIYGRKSSNLYNTAFAPWGNTVWSISHNFDIFYWGRVWSSTQRLLLYSKWGHCSGGRSILYKFSLL